MGGGDLRKQQQENKTCHPHTQKVQSSQSLTAQLEKVSSPQLWVLLSL